MRAIGMVRSPYTDIGSIPRCSEDRLDQLAEVEVFEEFAEGLVDVEGFSHLLLVTYLHRADRVKLTVVPPMDDRAHGVFATRSPHRPNHIAVSTVELVEVVGRTLRVRGVDLLDGTPVLDIKPYTRYDVRSDIRIGWMEGRVGRQGDD